MRHVAGASNRVRAQRNASFPRRRGEFTEGALADQKHAWSPAEPCGGLGAARGGPKRPPRKCVVTHFEARGPKEPQEPWRGAAAGGAGTF